MNTCICDKCKTEIQINIQEAVLNGSKEDPVTEQFFTCLHCGTRYTICIYDNFMRKRIGIRKTLTKNKYNRKWDEQLVKEMKEHFQELKQRYGRV